MGKLKGILFDYGHTLTYFPHYERTKLTATRNVQRTLRKFGVSVEIGRIEATIKQFALETDDVMDMDKEFTEILNKLGVKNHSQDDLQEIITVYWRPFVQRAQIRTGVKELLKHLKGLELQLGIVANIWSGGMNPVLEKHELTRFFDATVASVDVGFKKPDPEIFDMALDLLELSPIEVVMVGDNPRTDMQGAFSLSMGTIRFMRGPNRKVSDIVKPWFKIRNLSALSPIVHRLIEGYTEMHGHYSSERSSQMIGDA